MAISETHLDYSGFGVSCNGESDGGIDVTITGGTGVYTYLWDNGATTEDLSDIPAGFYSVVASDENGCSVDITVEITEPDFGVSVTETHSDYTGFGVSCNGESDGLIDITPAGGSGIYTYAWSNGETTQDLTGLAAGEYSVVVTDENGCSADISVEITETPAMTISETHLDYSGFGVSCNGASDGAIDITVTGGTGVYTYAWSSGETTEDLTDIPAGEYTLTVLDENGCDIDITVDITEPADGISVTEEHSDYSGFGVSCNGASDGFIDISPSGGSGGYTYLWSNGANTEDLTDIPAGEYTVTITDSNGCSIPLTVDITETPAMAISETHLDYSGFGVSCNGASDGAIDITVTGGTGVYTYASVSYTHLTLPTICSV